MCGIIGYTGHRPAVPVVMEGLERLEYRGYDSAGVAWILPGKLQIARAAGKIHVLENKLISMPSITSTCAMGHTRWATHGEPAERNAHPHQSNDGKLALVHNGIIENYEEIKRGLVANGYTFYSETDTEILVNLVSEKRKTEPDILHAFIAALREAHGAYAVCLLSLEDPGKLFAARMSAPLILGKGVGENFVASDIPAFLPYTRDVVFLEDGDVACITSSTQQIYRMDSMDKVDRPVQSIQWNMQAAQKDGYRHFMLKEIFEQPRVIQDGLAGRVDKGDKVVLPELDAVAVPERLIIVACGTSYHSGLWARHLFEDWAEIPVELEIASEYRYKEKILLNPGDMGIFISQSGETADSLAALKRARQQGLLSLGLCNVVGSSIAREADITIFTHAGPEISVASTKAMCSQMVALTLLAIYWGVKKGTISAQREKEILNQMANLPRIMDDNLPEMRKRAKELAPAYSGSSNFFFLGRGYCYALALEGALKLKELSYIHAEGYAAGEMKHGPIALIDPAFPSFVFAMDDYLFPKIKSNIEEIKSRLGKVIALTNFKSDLAVDDKWVIPDFSGPLAAFLILPALQLFSYEISDFLGKDVDQPRNLAKSVTVE